MNTPLDYMDSQKEINAKVRSIRLIEVDQKFVSLWLGAHRLKIRVPQNLVLKLEFLSNYLAELSLLEYGCVRFLPSLVAASAVFLARFTVNPLTHLWSSRLQLQTGYKPSQLKDCIHAIHDLQLNRKGSPFMAIREKYKQHMFQVCVDVGRASSNSS